MCQCQPDSLFNRATSGSDEASGSSRCGPHARTAEEARDEVCCVACFV